MSLISFLEGIWKDITDPTAQQQVTTNAATAAQAAYNNLLEKEQNAAKWVSSALAVINNNVTADAALVEPIIIALDPNVNVADITTTLVNLTATFESDQSKIPTTLVGAIQAIQAYLLPKTGNAWVVAIQGLLSLAVTIISPETPVQKIIAAGEFIYRDIVSPLLHLHPSTAPAVATVSATAFVAPVAQPEATPNPPAVDPNA